MYRLLLMILIWGVYSCCPVLASENITQQFKQANTAYSSKNYQKAIDGYEAILKAGYQSTELYYNLGNAYFKNNQLAVAILNYERALLSEPYNEDIQYNLKIANQRTVDNISVLRPMFLIVWWGAFRDFFSATAWARLAIALFWLGIGGLILWLMGQTRQLKKQGFIVGICLVALSIFVALTSWQRHLLEQDSGIAIIFAQETALESSPDAQSPDILLLHEGTKVELLDNIGDWYKVRLMNGEQGWLEQDSFVKI